jgi:hypothetical protein
VTEHKPGTRFASARSSCSKVAGVHENERLHVRFGHCTGQMRCPLFPQKRTFLTTTEMSALCHKQTHALQQFCCYSITSSATNGGLLLSVADVRSLRSDLGSPDWYTGNSN